MIANIYQVLLEPEFVECFYHPRPMSRAKGLLRRQQKTPSPQRRVLHRLVWTNPSIWMPLKQFPVKRFAMLRRSVLDNTEENLLVVQHVILPPLLQRHTRSLFQRFRLYLRVELGRFIQSYIHHVSLCRGFAIPTHHREQVTSRVRLHDNVRHLAEKILRVGHVAAILDDIFRKCSNCIEHSSLVCRFGHRLQA